MVFKKTGKILEVIIRFASPSLRCKIRNGKFNKTTTIPACGYFHTRQAKVRNHPYESHLKIKIDQKNTSRLSTKHPSSITTTVKATKCSRANANNSKLQVQICTVHTVPKSPFFVPKFIFGVKIWVYQKNAHNFWNTFPKSLCEHILANTEESNPNVSKLW